MPAAVKAGEWLYLFSSNSSALYEQDILNALAAPAGSLQTFRYDELVLEAETKKRWSDLPGTPVLVLFSIQQEARYFEPAFIPVRRGIVAATDQVGSRFFIDFRVDTYLSLLEPPSDDSEKYGERVTQFTKEIETRVREVPYSASASLGEPLAASEEDENLLFERTAEYLARTDSFREARFVRFLRIAEVGAKPEEGLRVQGPETGFELRAGHTYTLDLLHSQREELSSRESFTVSTDGAVLQIVGRAGFDIASRYDRVTIQLHATQGQTIEQRSTIVVVEPVSPIHGPRIEIPITVKPNRSRLGAISAAQTAALILVALPAVFTAWPLGLKLLSAIVGAGAAAGLQLLNVQGLKPTSLAGIKPAPASAVPAPTPAAPTSHH